jgi:hypothetical protein
MLRKLLACSAFMFIISPGISQSQNLIISPGISRSQNVIAIDKFGIVKNNGALVFISGRFRCIAGDTFRIFVDLRQNISFFKEENFGFGSDRLNCIGGGHTWIVAVRGSRIFQPGIALATVQLEKCIDFLCLSFFTVTQAQTRVALTKR